MQPRLAGEAPAVHNGERSMVVDRIEINPAVMLGKPVIRGTRITAELVLLQLI
jgi:uncharacterized protein (DUF433 family)